jgi:outer membrane protein
MPSTSRVLLLAAALAAGVFGASPVAAAPVASLKALERIALVDLQRCLLETTQGTKGKKDLEAVFSKGQSQLDKKTEDLKKKYEDLMAKRAMLSDDEIAKRQQELMVKDQELQQLYSQLQEDVATKEAQLTEKIYKNVSTIVKDIAAEEGLQIVLVRSPATVLYTNPKLDITNRVIVAYDKKHK